MDDMSELLSGILNSPEGMENLKKAASALLKGSSENEQKNQPSYGGGSDPAIQSLLRSLKGESGSRGGEVNGGSFDRAAEVSEVSALSAIAATTAKRIFPMGKKPGFLPLSLREWSKWYRH